MASLTVYNKQGKKVGEYAIEPSEIAPRISKQLLHEAVIMYQANERQGTKKTKSRADVAGTTKKMYRQKGTGNARAGSRRSGVRVGGGHIFALSPRDFGYRLPRKALQLATRMAIASKIADGQVVVVNELSFDAPRTKDMAALLKAVRPQAEKGAKKRKHTTLVAIENHDPNVYKSTRNICSVEIAPVGELNALTVLRPRQLVITKGALEALKKKAAATPKSIADQQAADGKSE